MNTESRSTTPEHPPLPTVADPSVPGALGPEDSSRGAVLHGELVDDPELGATTAEYGIVMLAAVGFAGLLVVILKSGEVKELLMNIIRTALSTG